MTALYEHDHGLFVPGPLTVGPWSPDAQHGGPVAALLAAQAEQLVDAVTMQIVRVTVELLRPVPLTPLAVTASVVRPGKKVNLIEVEMSASETVVARARALAIRRQAIPLPLPRAEPLAPPPPDGWQPSATFERTAFAAAVDLYFVEGGWDELGPVVMWSRLKVEVVAGRPVSPLQRTVAAADFGNGVSRVLDFQTHSFINPDLTVALSRVPEGEWVGFDVVSRLSTEGFGQAESQIFDVVGPAGRAVQSLIVDER